MQQDDSRNCFSRKRSVNELLHFEGDDSGYIEGKVFMTWPPRNRQHRINLEVAEDSGLYRFEVEVLHREGIAFRPHERVCIALKGAKVVQRKESSAPHCFPIVLRFPDGVILKYSSGINAGKVIDAWEGNTDEWYNPGVVHTISDAVTINTSEIRHAPVLSTIPQAPAPSCCDQDVGVSQPPPLIPMQDAAVTVQSKRPAQQPGTEGPGHSSKVRRRKKRKLHKEKEIGVAFPNQLIIDKPPPIDVATSRQEQAEPSSDPSTTNVSGSHPQPHLVSGGTNREISIPEDSGVDVSRGSNTAIVQDEASTSTLRLKGGIRTQRGDIYSSLSEVQKGPSIVNVIGIVVHVTPERKTSTNEWCRSIILVDRSTVGSPRQGVTVNCFQKKYPEWLPQVQKDDIVILRKLKFVEFNGVVKGTGYGDKLRWAVYDPLEHSIRHPQKGNAPEKELIDDGMGYEYSPYWEPFQDSDEIAYCREIGEWWKAMCAREGDKVSAAIKCSTALRRHLLISEASPDLPPQGFFDCTVEVLQKFSNDRGPTIVYVTDYTVNATVPPVRASWCPPQLADRVLRCNMWDSAGDIAKLMNPGEYWYLHNARAIWNSHYMEGTMQRAEKVIQLDETKLEAQPYLRALLVRKMEFELNSGPTSGLTSMHLFPEMLLQDVEVTTNFLTCIVELLHIDFNSRDGHFLYVTDYTYNPNLPTTVSTAVWAHNLDHRVVKIKLDDAQVKNLLALAPGDVYIIRNMRIRHLNVPGGIHGCLGGDDTLIVPFHDSSSHQAQQLQRNKEKWKRENMLNTPTITETDVVLKQSSTLSGNTASQEGVAGPAPNNIKVLARVMDFFPFSLEDACVLRCTKCNSCPLPSLNNCPRCDDMLETHCKWFYRLCILLQDDKGNEFVVSLSGKECTLLQDVDATDFRRDRMAFHKFLEKLDPILGNLRDVHLAWSKNEDKVIESPLIKFALESWDIDDEKGYGLLDYSL